MTADHTWRGGIPVATPPGRSQALANSYRSQCKRCPYAILAGQPAVWQRRPLVGLVHAGCAEVDHG